MKIEKYYENPSALHINTEDDRAYFIPYAKEKNDRMILLSGNDCPAATTWCATAWR